MNKKLKITYWVVMALNAVVCIVDIATAYYFGAVITGVSLVWLGVSYCLADIIAKQDDIITSQDELIASTLAELTSADTQLAQSQAREKIHH